MPNFRNSWNSLTRFTNFVCMCRCMRVCMWWPEVNFGVIFRQGLSLGLWGLLVQLGYLAGQQVPEIVLPFTYSVLGLQVPTIMPSFCNCTQFFPKPLENWLHFHTLSVSVCSGYCGFCSLRIRILTIFCKYLSA